MSYAGRFVDLAHGDAWGSGNLPLSARIARPNGSSAEAVPPLAPDRHDGLGGGGGGAGSLMNSASCTLPGGGGPLLRKKLYDQNLSDWSARHRKNRQHLDVLVKDCEQLRCEVARQQQEVDERTETYNQLEERFTNEVLVKFNESKTNLDMLMQQKHMLAVQMTENRKHKAQLSKDKRLLQADFERRHQEMLKTVETRDKLEAQLSQLTQHLAQVTGDRRRIERELDAVQNNLRANTELADEVHHEIEHVCDGIKDSMGFHGTSLSRLDGSPSLRDGAPSSPVR